MSILPKAIYKLNAIRNKTPMVFSEKIEKFILTCTCNLKEPQNSQNIFVKEQSWKTQTS